MAIAIIICIALIAITAIICYTVYIIQNNSKLDELYNEIKSFEMRVGVNNDYFHKHWDAVNDYKMAISELIDLVKENCLNIKKK